MHTAMPARLARRLTGSATAVVLVTAVAATMTGIGPSAATPAAGVVGVSAAPTAVTPSHPVRPHHRKVRVPKVVGMTESKAQCALAAAGLRWRFRGDDVVHRKPVVPCTEGAVVTPDAKVIAQSPKGGARVHHRRVIVLDDECLKRVRMGQSPCL